MNFHQPKKAIEPFNLFGERSLIYSKDEAVKILKDNSYYIFVASAMAFGFFAFVYFSPADVGNSKFIFLIVGLLYLSIGLAVRKLQSRVASIFAFLCFGSLFLQKLIDYGLGGSFLAMIFLAASYRCIRASFYFHDHFTE